MKRGKRIGKRDPIKHPKKDNTKKIILTFTIILITLILVFILLKNLSLTTKVIEKPPTPENCSNESIRKAWEFVFKGSSENLSIVYTPNLSEMDDSEEESELYELFFPKGCPIYYVYQINGNNIRTILGTDMWFFMNIKGVVAIDIEYIPEEIMNITGKLNSDKAYLGDSKIFIMEEFLNNNTIPRMINTTQEAKDEFESVFNITSSNWTVEESTDFEGANVTVFGFIENETLENITIFGEEIDPLGTIVKAGIIFQNYSINMYTYADISLIKRDLEKKFGNWTSPINTSIKNITIEVNNSKLRIADKFNLFSESPSGIQKVEITENNKTIVETEINFTEEGGIDWTKIVLKKQEINSTRGYVIINGLNFTKNITVDRLDNESKSVCIKDKEINSISEISETCNSSNEYLLECPGNFSDNTTYLTCKIWGGKFIVTGLAHSAVIEMLPEIEEEPCIPNWACDEWSDYEDQCGYRICSDLNNCMNLSGKPLEYKECPICIPNWECTDFLPENCPKSERRTRTCTDLNNCRKNEDMPNTTQTCERQTNWTWIILGVSIGIGILLIIILSVGRDKKHHKKPRLPPETQEKPYKEDSDYPKRQEQKPASNKSIQNQTPSTHHDIQLRPPRPGEEDYYYPEGGY